MSDLFDNILKDLKVELSGEFDRNFEREAFFSKPWNPKAPHGLKCGHLRTSITSRITGNSLHFSSSLPYASIHNTGGTITVTKKMRGFFWIKYRETGKPEWKYLALKKVGSKIAIPQRQFVGYSPELDPLVEDIISDNIDSEMDEIVDHIKIQFENNLNNIIK